MVRSMGRGRGGLTYLQVGYVMNIILNTKIKDRWKNCFVISFSGKVQVKPISIPEKEPCLFQKTQKCPFPFPPLPGHVCRSIYNFFRYMFWLDFAKMFLLFKYQFPVACCPNSKRQERGSSKTKENTVTRWTRYGCPGSVIVPRYE